MTNEVICPYCHMGALRMTGRELYPARPELADKHYHVCRNCNAWTACADGTWEPLGRLANAELRRAKQNVYAAIEPICAKAIAEHGWSKSLAKTVVYKWLAGELDIPEGSANIGEFDLKQCELVLLICQYREPDLKTSRNLPSKNGGKPFSKSRRFFPRKPPTGSISSN